MPQPVSYNPGTPVSGSIQENNISYVVDGQQRDYRGGFGGLSWMSEVPAVNNVIFIGNSTSLGRGPANIPLFYPSFNNTEANIVYAVNTLPGSPGNFTTSASAYEWAVTNNFFINNSDNPIPRIDADGLVFYLDASQPTSYPQTGTSWYDLSGQSSNGSLINGPTFDPKGWLTLDGIDDYISVPNNYSFNTGNGTDYTFEIWFKMRTLPTVQYGPNGHVWGGQNGNNVVMYLNPASGGISKGLMVYDDTRYDGSMTTTGGFSANTWSQWVITGNGTNNTVTHYINGELDRGPTGVLPTSQYVNPWGFGQTKLGFDTRWNTYSTLDIAVARQFTRQLSATEIKQNYFQSNIVTDGLVFAVDPSNLVSYESGSTITYSLTGSYTGSLQNGVEYLPSNGGVFNFDGTNDIIRSQNINPSEITIEVWKKWTMVSDDWLITNQTSTVTDTTKGYFMRIDEPSFNFTVYFGIGSTSRPIVYNPIVLGEWTHVVATYDPITEGAKLYWNGVLVGTNIGTGAIDYTGVQGLTIGAANNLSRATPGPVGPVRIYNRALSSSEVQQNYEATKYRFGL
jgi:hypothetical protein